MLSNRTAAAQTARREFGRALHPGGEVARSCDWSAALARGLPGLNTNNRMQPEDRDEREIDRRGESFIWNIADAQSEFRIFLFLCQ